MNPTKKIFLTSSLLLLVSVLILATPFLRISEKFLASFIALLNVSGEKVTNLLLLPKNNIHNDSTKQNEESHYNKILFDLESENVFLKRQLGLIENLTRGVSNINKIFAIEVCNVVHKSDSSGWHESISVDAGEDRNIKPGFFVVYGNNLVGRVRKSYPTWSLVELSTNESFKISVYIHNAKSNENVKFKEEKVGLFLGSSKGYGTVDWISVSEEVYEDDYVYTHGNDKLLCPDGLLVGKVSMVSQSRAGHKYYIRVKPQFSVDDLDVVFILRSKRVGE